MHAGHSDWAVSRSLPGGYAAMGEVLIVMGLVMQSYVHVWLGFSVSILVELFGAFVVFYSRVKIRVSPYSSRMGIPATEVIVSSVPESLLVISTLYGLANIIVYLAQSFSFLGIDIWTFLTIPVTTVGWIVFEGFLATLSYLSRGPGATFRGETRW